MKLRKHTDSKNKTQKITRDDKKVEFGVYFLLNFLFGLFFFKKRDYKVI